MDKKSSLKNINRFIPHAFEPQSFLEHFDPS